MLSVGKIAAGPQAARYYTEQVARGREDYYAGEGEAPGKWTGNAAAALGLQGEVAEGQLEHVLAGAGLRRPAREGAVAGFDLTFRAPKSVSVLWGVAEPAVVEQLGAAHDAAVASALAYVEREACRGRRGAGGVVQVRGNGFVAAAFRHRASRAGDPLLHTHVVAGNLTQGPDGRWTALDARHLYRHAKTAGFLYQAELRRELTERLGLQWGPVERGTADIVGVPRDVVEHFSTRRAEILRHMADHGGRSAASAQVAALETRRAKQEMRGDRLREQWRARAAEHGLSVREVERILRPGSRLVPFAEPVPPEAMTRDASVFGRPELLQALAEAQPQGAKVEELERLADAALAEREVVALPRAPAPAGTSEARFTTRELLVVEQDLLGRAGQAVATGRAQVPVGEVVKACDATTLSDDQRAAVIALCGQGDGVAVLRAPAGTGKTFALDAARTVWQAQGFDVLGSALSARAALELSDQAGIASMTLAQLTARLDEGGRLPCDGVLVVDEAGMVGTRMLARLAEAAEESRAKLVLVGDDRQLPEIHAGGAFHALAERLPTVELREVRRQRESWDRQALDALRSGEVERWACAYRQHGRITVAESAGKVRDALVNDWSRAAGDRLMIAARREDVADLNHRARRLLQDRGELPYDELVIGGRGFATGDRVVGARNDRRAGLLNGQRATITRVDDRSRTVEVALSDGKAATLEAGYLEAGHLEHGYAITAHRAQGATVDRTFVLGSEELYREWGYTALSRHRDQARFYVAETDLRQDEDLPPRKDPIVHAVARLMERSNGKALALESLPEADRRALEEERRELRSRFMTEAPPRRYEDVDSATLDRRAEILAASERREEMLRERRQALRWYDRRGRAEVDRSLENNAGEQARCRDALLDAVNRVACAGRTDDEWAVLHGPAARRLLSIDEELRARDSAAARVARRSEVLRRAPETITPPTFELDGPDLDLGL